MATNFPNSPSNGDTHVFGGTTYTYNSTKGVWKAAVSSGGGGGASVTTSDTAPSSPSDGDLWFDSSVAKTYIYYNDGSSSQWVQMNPSGGSDGADGADATGDGESPVIYTEPPTTVQSLNSDGTTSTVQMQAVDPEGTAITYGIAYANSTNARPAQLSADTTINQTTGTYTFTPSTTSSDAGTFKARLSASDGIQTSTRFVNFSLQFAAAIEYLLLGGGGAGATHGDLNGAAGGGGAGGMIEGTTSLQIGTTYNITVGSGGTAPASGGDGGDGGNTTFNSLTALGGGGGGGFKTAGRSGGSGGGGGGRESYAGGSSTQTGGFGNAGGAAHPNNNASDDSGGGGGGAGGAGVSASSQNGGTGGAGRSNDITGTAVFYAIGGGGGSENGSYGGAGSTGGGVGGNDSQTASTGSTYGSGGGGGGGNNNTGADGQVGAVIIRTTNTASATTGSPNLTTDGSYNIYTFTADGSITF